MARNIFNSIKLPKIGSNNFDLSHDVKLTFSMGELVPTCVMDVVPGDKVRISTENMLRFLPLISPVMHRVNVTTHYFFVPNRLLWPEWENWITGESDVEAPYLNVNASMEPGSLGDYLGMPTPGSFGGMNVNALPFAAYLKIYDEYYRDQNLQDKLFSPLTPGNNNENYGDNPERLYEDLVVESPLRRAWQHDYFTSALPFAQKGDAVTLPLIQGGPVTVTNVEDPSNTIIRMTATDAPAPVGDMGTIAGGIMGVGGSSAYIDPNGNLEVDINDEASTINTLRRAFRLQEWLEKNARGGTRYIENILTHFGVRSSDSRLQRPEYIGGDRQNMVISEVLSSAQTVDQSDNDVPIGQMAGHGISVGGGNSFSYRAEEHGFIIGIINVQPVTAYQQGLPKMFSRFDRLDYFWPSFANIGEQEVKVKELYVETDTAPELEETFGYVPRYSEYKYMPSRVHGEMKTSLAYWHMGRIFSSKPTLSDEFIKADPTTRIFAVTDPNEDHIVAHVFNNIRAIRKMPKYGTPTI